MAQLKSTKVFGDLNVTGEVNVSTKITVNGEEVWDTGNLLNIGTTAATARTALGLGSGATRWPTWSEVSGKPSTYAPSGHTHPISQVTGLGTAATRNVGESAGNVLERGAFGLGYAKRALDFATRIDSGFYLSTSGSVGMPSGMVSDGGWMINLNWAYNNEGNRYNCSFYGNVQNDFIGFRRINNQGVAGTPVELHHTGNILQATGTSTTYLMSQKAVTDQLATKAASSHTHPTSQVTGLDTALAEKAVKTTQVIAGTGLSGGGSLAANRTLAVSYGTAAGTAAQGNDSRLSNSREWTATTVSQTEAQAGTATTRRAWTAQMVRQAITGWWNSSSDKTKLDGIAAGATANATNAQLRDRSTHTGTQAISTVAGLQAALDNIDGGTY